ncbi:NrfD/PsrC family molybdoenzyme membrane anchor subunit [Geomesophilobacter sediminis]|uniref:Polysulfide reductase NrfD n=1 Tax=Geomesophilobacter sediminis TaxID=2798584 RepID=A0A8J7IP02_9BACT|nr:NrfD/PsrC family molybdoenzyme membrane anchor subunit [Geomesophilobacter sediminis]MBJ6723934.1 polysulfide reductase NrfD [Geomesophilobacter sediminis]
MNPDFAVLTGEAAEQKVKHPEPKGTTTTPVPVWSTVPSLSVQPIPDYYRLPLLKQPVWIWSVPTYFYVGGLAGGGAVLAAVLHGKRSLRTLAFICRILAFVGTTIGPGLLTWDLGKKQRFYNMLRVFRPTSPMSIGSWALAGSGGLATLALLQGDREEGAAVRWALAGGGLMLAGYTGVLLGNTANPLWHGARRSLPVLFTASSMASTAGLLEFLPLNRCEEQVADRFGVIGKIAETASMEIMEREAGRNPVAAKAFEEGTSGLLWKSAKALVVAGTVLSLLPFKARWKRRLGGTLTTAGAICLRYALLEAGRQAARDPQAVIIEQRSRR